MSIRVLLVDDHQIVRIGLRSVLEKEGDFEIVGEAKDGFEAVELVRQVTPHVVVLDVSMPGMNGTEAARQIKSEAPEIKIVVSSMYDRREFVLDLLRAGVNAYILKTDAAEHLVPAIRTALREEIYLVPRVTTALVGECLDRGEAIEAASRTLLSGRERQVLQLIAEGKSSKQVARMLGVEESTVVVHRRNIMGKLNLHSVAELTKYAVQQGITSLEIFPGKPDNFLRPGITRAI